MWEDKMAWLHWVPCHQCMLKQAKKQKTEILGPVSMAGIELESLGLQDEST